MKKLIYFLLILTTSSHGFSQLSGFSTTYGIGFKQPLHESNDYVKLNPFNIEYHQYLHRFWSASAVGQFAQGNFNDPNHLNGNFQLTTVGANINYWFLNDIRLLGKMARSSCKGKLVALTYKFRMYLSGGIYGNWLKRPEQTKTFGSYSLGLGVNFWQFRLGGQTTMIHESTSLLIIPFAKVDLVRAFSPFSIGDTETWDNNQLEFKLGLKFAFAGR